MSEWTYPRAKYSMWSMEMPIIRMICAFSAYLRSYPNMFMKVKVLRMITARHTSIIMVIMTFFKEKMPMVKRQAKIIR